MNGLDLVTVHPAFVVGPPRGPRDDGVSMYVMKAFAAGSLMHQVFPHTATSVMSRARTSRRRRLQRRAAATSWRRGRTFRPTTRAVDVSQASVPGDGARQRARGRRAPLVPHELETRGGAARPRADAALQVVGGRRRRPEEKERALNAPHTYQCRACGLGAWRPRG